MTVWVGSVACATCCWTVSYAVTYLEFNLFLFSYFYFTRNSTLMFCFCDFPFRSRSTINSIALKSHHGDQFQVTMVTGVEQPSGWCTLPSPPPRPLLLSLWVARIYELQQQVITLVRTLLLQWDCYWVSPGEENNIFYFLFFLSFMSCACTLTNVNLCGVLDFLCADERGQWLWGWDDPRPWPHVPVPRFITHTSGCVASLLLSEFISPYSSASVESCCTKL